MSDMRQGFLSSKLLVPVPFSSTQSSYGGEPGRAPGGDSAPGWPCWRGMLCVVDFVVLGVPEMKSSGMCRQLYEPNHFLFFFTRNRFKFKTPPTTLFSVSLSLDTTSLPCSKFPHDC